jgi:CubicO group peptidase (beta-lactamase class C family)
MNRVITPIAVLALGMSLHASLAGTTGKADAAARIHRVESGLVAPVVVNDRPMLMNLTDRMAFYKVPGISVAVIDGGQIAWAKGYGVKVVGGKDPVTPETLFQSASIGKMITAATAMRLVELGQLSLTADINGVLRTWQLPENEFTAKHKVTLEGLLSHTAGIAEGTDGGELVKQTLPLPTLNQVLDGLSPAAARPIRVVDEPGAHWVYSSAGYTIVEKLIEDVTKGSFERAVSDYVLRPARMKDSRVDRSLPEALRSSAAYGHEADDTPIERGWYQLNAKGYGAVWSTPSDLALFAIELERAARGQSAMLRPETLRQMLRVRQNGYGLGMFVSGVGEDQIFSHTGHNSGYRGILAAYVDRGQGAVILSNGETSSKLIFELLRSIAIEYGWSDYIPTQRTLGVADKSLFHRFVGEYELFPGTTITVSAADGKLFVLAPPIGSEKLELLPISPVKFFVTADDTTFTFELGDTDLVKTLTVEPKGQRFEAHRK